MIHVLVGNTAAAVELPPLIDDEGDLDGEEDDMIEITVAIEDHVHAVACQKLKALEQVTVDAGDWSRAWALTGLPKGDGARPRRGGAHPIEVSAGTAHLKKTKTVEEHRAAAQEGDGKNNGSGEP